MQHLWLQKKDCHFLGNCLIPLGSCFLVVGEGREANVWLCFHERFGFALYNIPIFPFLPLQQVKEKGKYRGKKRQLLMKEEFLAKNWSEICCLNVTNSMSGWKNVLHVLYLRVYYVTLFLWWSDICWIIFSLDLL